MTSDQIFEQLGIAGGSDELKSEVLGQVLTMTDLRFSRAVDDIMTDKEQQEFDEFSEGKDPAEIAKWLEDKYEGISEVYDEIIKQVVSELSESATA